MSYRDDLGALSARHDALAAEVAEKTRELAQARQLLDEAHERTRLPILPNIRVATPCYVDWNHMRGDDRVRACAQCNKNVYHLSNMTRAEAEALIIEKEGDLCVRYYQRADGTIRTTDCEVGVAQRRKRRLVAAGVAALIAAGNALACRMSRPKPPEAAAQTPIEQPVDKPVETPPVVTRGEEGTSEERHWPVHKVVGEPVYQGVPVTPPHLKDQLKRRR